MFHKAYNKSNLDYTKKENKEDTKLFPFNNSD